MDLKKLTQQVEKLGDICSFVNGDRGKNYPSTSAFIEKGIPFINAGNLSKNKIDTNKLNYISRDRFDLLSSGKIRKGDFLFCLRGSLGKFAIVDNIIEGAIASSLVIIRGGDRVTTGYLLEYLRSSLCQNEIEKFGNGAAQPNLSAKDLGEFKIPLPPLSEQKRIAAILDKADSLRRKRQQAIQLADQFLRSVFLDLFGDLEINPKNWETRTLGDCITVGPTNGLYKHSSDYGEGTPILRIDGFYDGYMKSHESMKRVLIAEDELNKFRLKNGSVVINRVNSKEYLGKCALIENLIEPTVFESNMMNFELNESIVHPRFVVDQMCTEFIKRQILTNSKDAVNQSSINQANVRSFNIRVPALKLQQRYVEIVSKFILSKKTNMTHMRECNSLFSSLSQKAFAGEL